MTVVVVLLSGLVLVAAACALMWTRAARDAVVPLVTPGDFEAALTAYAPRRATSGSDVDAGPRLGRSDNARMSVEEWLRVETDTLEAIRQSFAERAEASIPLYIDLADGLDPTRLGRDDAVVERVLEIHEAVASTRAAADSAHRSPLARRLRLRALRKAQSAVEDSVDSYNHQASLERHRAAAKIAAARKAAEFELARRAVRATAQLEDELVQAGRDLAALQSIDIDDVTRRSRAEIRTRAERLDDTVCRPCRAPDAFRRPAALRAAAQWEIALDAAATAMRTDPLRQAEFWDVLSVAPAGAWQMTSHIADVTVGRVRAFTSCTAIAARLAEELHRAQAAAQERLHANVERAVSDGRARLAATAARLEAKSDALRSEIIRVHIPAQRQPERSAVRV